MNKLNRLRRNLKGGVKKEEVKTKVWRKAHRADLLYVSLALHRVDLVPSQNIFSIVTSMLEFKSNRVKSTSRRL